MLLGSARQESRHIDERDDGNVEGIEEADEARSLDTGVDVEAASKLLGLVGDDANRAALEARHSDHNVLGIVGHDLCVCVNVRERLRERMRDSARCTAALCKTRTSKKSCSSTTELIMSRISYGTFESAGTSELSESSVRNLQWAIQESGAGMKRMHQGRQQTNLVSVVSRTGGWCVFESGKKS